MYNNIRVQLAEDMINQITGEVIIQEGRKLSLDSITGILKVVKVYDVYDISVMTLESIVNPMTKERVVDPGEVLTVYELNQIRNAIRLSRCYRKLK
jgi:hypothetical protein